MRINRARRFFAGFLVMLLVLAALPAYPADADPAPPELPGIVNSPTYKFVWLYDSTLDLPFCRLYLPDNWRVEGNVAWNMGSSVNSFSIWIRLTDPKQKALVELLQPGGFHFWNEKRSARLRIRDGDREANAMFHNLRPRSAAEFGEEFVAPLVAKILPDARRTVGEPTEPLQNGWIRLAMENADASIRGSGSEVEQSSGGAAAMEFTDGASAFRVVTGVTRHDLRTRSGEEVVNWYFDNLLVSSMPQSDDGGGAFPAPGLATLIANPAWLMVAAPADPSAAPCPPLSISRRPDGFLRIADPAGHPVGSAFPTPFLSTILVNPAWRAQANNMRTEIALRRSMTAGLVNVREDIRRKLDSTRVSGVRLEIREHELTASHPELCRYSDPDPAATRIERKPAEYGLVNSMAEALILSGLRSNLVRIGEWKIPKMP